MCKGRRILVGDGKPLADMIQEYNELCKEKRISMIEALDSSVHINQLRDPTFKCNILTTMSMIRGYKEEEILPAYQPHKKVSRAGIKIDKSESSNEETVPVIEPIPDSDEGVDDIPELITGPNPGVIFQATAGTTETNWGVVQVKDVATREPNKKRNGNFPHKYIFKDIMKDTNLVKKVAARYLHAAKNVFFKPRNRRSARRRRKSFFYSTVAKPPYTAVINPDLLTKPAKEEMFLELKDKLLSQILIIN